MGEEDEDAVALDVDDGVAVVEDVAAMHLRRYLILLGLQSIDPHP
jgi:hypothetical protein